MANQKHHSLSTLLTRCSSVDPDDKEDVVDTHHDDIQWEEAQYGNQYED